MVDNKNQQNLMYTCGNVPKRGDLIKLTRISGMNAQLGVRARVSKIVLQNNTYYINIMWIDEKANNQSNGAYHASYFELVSRWVDEIAENNKEHILDKWGGKGLYEFKKFYKIVEVMGKVPLRRMAEELDLGDSEFRERLWDWAYLLGYTIRDNEIIGHL